MDHFGVNSSWVEERMMIRVQLTPNSSCVWVRLTGVKGSDGSLEMR